MIVLTVDQKGSRRVGDRVEALLQALGRTGHAGVPGVVRPFERTVGDEVQGVLADTDLAVRLALDVLRLGSWSVGIGAGAVDEPLPETARAGSGDAFVLAREAVERAKTRGRAVPVAVATAEPRPGQDCEAVLSVVGAIMARRTPSGWAVIDTVQQLGPGATQHDVAARLGITQQAVSQRLRTALWSEEVALRPVAARLLAEGDTWTAGSSR